MLVILHVLQVWSVCHFSCIFESCRRCWIWKDDRGAGGNSTHNPSRSVTNADIIASCCANNFLWRLECDISIICCCVGKDILAKAKTGTGKTVAFLVLLFYLQSTSWFDVVSSNRTTVVALFSHHTIWLSFSPFFSASSYWGSLHIASSAESVTATYKFARDVSN
jgi:hypothetical protein